MIALLLPLLAAVPVMAAALAAMMPWRIIGRLLALAVPVITALSGIGLLVHHHAEPVVAAQVGAFVPGVAI
ncbi:monovalent cation/H+ antiporter subunit D family protein, partial [Dietzia sp. NPDC055343]